MWLPKPNFITLHYGWILSCALLAFPILYPYGNLDAVDVFFFGSSGSTESGLNTVDVKDLKTYQQVYIYIIPAITNLMFVNIAVVVVRLYWFRRRLTNFARNHDRSVEDGTPGGQMRNREPRPTRPTHSSSADRASVHGAEQQDAGAAISSAHNEDSEQEPVARTTTITFNQQVDEPRLLHEQADGNTLRVPGPRERDAGHPLVELANANSQASVNKDGDAMSSSLQRTSSGLTGFSGLSRRRPHKLNVERPAMQATLSIERAATSVLALGHTPPPPKRSYWDATNWSKSQIKMPQLPRFSRQVTVGRNSQFHNLTSADREILGGIEYRALKLLLMIVLGYFVGLHLLGIMCLFPWIHHAPQKYLDWLDECGQGRTWWAFYSAQTMVDNLGFTLTPDSMASFKDATWPMFAMTFMAFAGNTFYPIFLRLVIWVMFKLAPRDAAIKDDLRFLLDHPRRCYTLLFPSTPTWILFGILFVLNFIDVLLIIVLDLENPAVNDLPMGPRILSALFQAASARHTGTSTLALADVNPAVQFSLLVMMYIAVFPIAISIRASNTYEEKSLGVYEKEDNPDESNSRSYVMTHIRNQLSFDLWYIFLGTFIICIAESGRIMDESEPSFSVFPVIFECVSAYGNVGLSLGHPDVMTSFCGQFTTFSKVVICLMMLRGRHRMLPYALDRAIMLPSEAQFSENGESTSQSVDEQPVDTAGSGKDAHLASNPPPQQQGPIAH